MITSDKRVDAESVDVVVVPLLRCREQLSNEVKVRVHLSCSVEQTLGNDDGSVVAVVQSESLKYPRHCLRVELHVSPEPWRVFGTVAIAQLDGVTPHYQLSLEVDLMDYFVRKKEGERKLTPGVVDISYSHPTLMLCIISKPQATWLQSTLPAF